MQCENDWYMLALMQQLITYMTTQVILFSLWRLVLLHIICYNILYNNCIHKKYVL